MTTSTSQPGGAAATDADDREGTDIHTAARLLGVQVETLRKRLQRGGIEGFKAADGTWRVVLDEATLRAPPADADEAPGAARLLAEIAEIREQAAELAEETRRTATLLTETRDAVDRLQRLIEAIQRPSGDPGGDQQLRPVMMAVLEYLQKTKA